MTVSALELLAGTLDAAPLAVIAVDTDCRYRIWNRAAADLTGIAASEALGRTPTEVLGDREGAIAVAACHELIAHGTIGEPTITYRWSGPKRPVVRAHRSAVRDVGGRVIGAMVHLLDVTADAERAVALEQSEALMQGLFDHAPVGIALVRDGTFVRSNPALERVLGYGAEELSTLPAMRALFPNGKVGDETDASLLAHLRAGAPFALEAEYVCKDGRNVVLLMHGVGLVPGEPDKGAIISFVDVTERHAAERALRESERRFRLFADNIDSFVYFADPATRKVMYFNARQYQELYGGDPAELARNYESVWRYVHPDDHDKLWAMRDRAYADGGGEADFRIQHPLKGERIAHLRMYPTKLDDGRMLSFGIVDDVTEERTSQAQRLAEMVEQRDKLVREVHHRIKNNLQGVAGLLQQTARVRPQIAGLLTEVVGQIQAISQVHGLQMRAREAIPLSDMLQNVLANAAALLNAKLPISFSGNALTRMRLPEQEAVPVALVVTELATNALKYRHEGSEARAAISCQNEQAELLVANRGQLPEGFSFDKIARSTNGLGLVKSLLPRRGGSLTIEQVGDEVVVRMSLVPPAVVFEESTPA